MKSISYSIILLAAVMTTTSCSVSTTASNPKPTPTPLTSPRPATLPVAASFAYAVGESETLTQAKDRKDQWYNALDFGANNHLGEDWNKNSGGNTDCGEKVFSIADGRIVYAENAGPGWGNVVIIDHELKDGTRVQSLYGHLQKILTTTGDVKMREQIGEVGNADGRYYCHLHLELRTPESASWNVAGGGYSSDRKGWLDPSDFIDKQRRAK